MSLMLPTALFETIITSTISKTETTIPLDSLDDGQGSTLVNGALVGLILDEGEDSGNSDFGEEYIIGTVDTAGVRLTSCRRGVSLVDGWTEVAANQKKHRRGASAKTSSHPYLVRVIRALNGTDQFDADNIMAYDANPALTPGSNELATVKYADDLSLAGAPNATDTQKGIVEVATAAEVTAGTELGATGASLVATPDVLAAQIQAGSWIYGLEDGTGSDDTYTWSTTPVTTAYTNGMLRIVKFTVANTGACTGNENGIGAKSIKKYAAGALAELETGDIVANGFAFLYYDSGTDIFVLLNPSLTLPTTAILTEMSAFFAATDLTGAEAETLSSSATSNADSLHTHSPAALDAALFAGGNIHIPLYLQKDSVVISGGNFGGNEIYPLPGSFYVNTGNSASGWDAIRTDSVGSIAGGTGEDGLFFSTGGVYLGSQWTAKIRVKFQTAPASTDTFFIGFAHDADTLDATGANPSTGRHIGYLYNGTNWKVSTADGTTQETTTVSAPSTGWHELKIIRGASSVSVYLDGTLLATHSTNIPSTGQAVFYNGFINNAAGSRKYEIGRMIDMYLKTT